MRWPKRAASNGYDLGRDAPFGIVRLPAHSSWLGDRRGALRGASFLFGRRDGDRTAALRRLRQRWQVRLGGRKRALAVRPDRLELISCRLEQDDRGLAVLAAPVGELDSGMDRLQLAGARSLLVVRLDRPLPLALERDELAERQLMEPAEQPDQQDDGDRDPDQPEQKTFTHCVLLVRLAHINVRWELRFHGMTQAESREKAGVFASEVACASV
jgi:hypothetical protein